MPPYKDDSEIIKRSLEELKEISLWLDRKEKSGSVKPLTVLIGGWAVYSYNRWYGSIDIDLITNSEIKNDLMRYLIDARGYFTDRSDGQTTVYKRIKTEAGHRDIIIDFIMRSRAYPFEGPNISLDFNSLDANTINMIIDSDAQIRVPVRTLLLIYKLKAAWDRNYRLTNNRSLFPERESAKLEKDYSDILSLIDPGHYRDDLDVRLLGSELSKYQFLCEVLRSLPDKKRPVDNYGKMDIDSVRKVCGQILSVTGQNTVE